MKLNKEQSKHFATSLRAYGIGQLAAFGYAGIQTSDWTTVIVSGIILIVLEFIALRSLRKIKE